MRRLSLLLAFSLSSLMPVGCAPVKLKHYPGQEGRLHLPATTEERLKECVEQLKDTIDAGSYSVDAKLKIDEDGEVVGVETEGTPNPDVGACMRIALRGTRLSEDVLERGMLRSSAATDGPAMPDRGQIGEVVTIVVVTVVFTEVLIEAFAITIGITVTAALTTGAAEAIAKRRKRVTCQENLIECLGTSWGGKLGSHQKASLCKACFDLCRDDRWPPSANMSWGTESCKFPGYREYK